MTVVNCKHCHEPIEPDPVANGRTWRHVEPVIDDDRNAPCVRRYAEPCEVSERCGQSGGYGAPGNHECLCVLKQGHMTRIPEVGHGCRCGAIWGRMKATQGEEG